MEHLLARGAARSDDSRQRHACTPAWSKEEETGCIMGRLCLQDASLQAGSSARPQYLVGRTPSPRLQIMSPKPKSRRNAAIGPCLLTRHFVGQVRLHYFSHLHLRTLYSTWTAAYKLERSLTVCHQRCSQSRRKARFCHCRGHGYWRAYRSADSQLKWRGAHQMDRVDCFP